MSDKDFKQSQIEGFEKLNLPKEWREKYNPDVAVKKDKTVIIMESSSTGDRKVHIGELAQFLAFVNSDTEYEEFYYVLLLCGVSENSPKEATELSRLQFYYDNYPISKNKREKIKGIYIKEEKSDKLTLTLDEIKKYECISL